MKKSETTNDVLLKVKMNLTRDTKPGNKKAGALVYQEDGWENEHGLDAAHIGFLYIRKINLAKFPKSVIVTIKA